MDDDREIEQDSSASLVKKRGMLSRYIRYKEIIDKSVVFLRFYKQANLERRMSSWTFSSFCYECGKSGGTNLTDCPGCHVVSYCSRNCKAENWRKGHKQECKMGEEKGVRSSASASKAGQGASRQLRQGAGKDRAGQGVSKTRTNAVYKRRQSNAY